MGKNKKSNFDGIVSFDMPIHIKNDKEEEIKNTVRDVENVKKSVNQLAKENEQAVQKERDIIAMRESEARMDGELAKANRTEEKSDTEQSEVTVIQETEGSSEENNNNKILELYKDGFTNIEIAKMLNLGMGEVRLVIDLYKNRTR